MEPKHTSPLEECRQVEDQLQFERGVLFSIREQSKGRTIESLFIESVNRVEILESRKKRLEDILHGRK